MNPDTLFSRLVSQSKKASPDQLAQMTQQAAAAPFAEDLLEVDEPLWGSFWQGDVIAPGYRLPALELAWLRAVRLDRAWPEDTTVPRFLADLRQAMLDPRAGIWTLIVAGEPCVVFAEPGENPKSKIKNHQSITVVWYCASTGRLHAGYRTSPEELPRQMGDAIKHRGVEAEVHLEPAAKEKKRGWLAQVAGAEGSERLAARLDLAILRIRAGAG